VSQWKALAVERLGPPDPTWPSIWGPASPGADPVSANGLRTYDLSPFLLPLGSISQTMERDLSKASMASINLDLSDATGSLAEILGPFSEILGVPGSRYFGPWIRITESWPGGSAIRFTGYLDETSLEWDQDQHQTSCTVLHATQLLSERNLADIQGFLRAYPATPAAVDTTMVVSTGDDLLAKDANTAGMWTARANALDIEKQLWSQGMLSWESYDAVLTDRRTMNGQNYDYVTDYPVPKAPSSRLTIGGTTYSIRKVMDHPDSALTVQTSETDPLGWLFLTYRIAVLALVGPDGSVPDLTNVLSVGETLTFTQSEAERTHYLLALAVAAPESGAEGPDHLMLDTVDQLVPGDDLSFYNSLAAAPTLTVRVAALDGEKNQVMLTKPISDALAAGMKIRRNSRVPVLVDALAAIRLAIAPFSLETTQLVEALASDPVVSWLPYDLTTPSLYGVVEIQPLDRNGKIRLSRRGTATVSGGWQDGMVGVWEGSLTDGLTYKGLSLDGGTKDPALPMRSLGDPCQWPSLPAGSSSWAPPTIGILGDLSGHATTPPNGWRSRWRSIENFTRQGQRMYSIWDGTLVEWSLHEPDVDLPPTLVAWVGSLFPRQFRVTGASWFCTEQTADGNAGMGAEISLSPSGLPSGGSWLALGMGAWIGSLGHEEALLGLYVSGTASPFTKVQAVLLPQVARSGSSVTRVAQVVTLWDSSTTGSQPCGVWALGGGLALQVTKETINGQAMPRSYLYFYDGSGLLVRDLAGMEILPGTIHPLCPTGQGSASRLGGWYCLAIESYQDTDSSPDSLPRRLRFLHLGPDLKVVNGDLEASPWNPLDTTLALRRGEVIHSTLSPTETLAARMVRVNVTDNAMLGFAGGRLFQVHEAISRTLDQIPIDSMTALDLVENAGQALLASAVPTQEGGYSLVSRRAGVLRLREIGTHQAVSIADGEESQVRITQSNQAFVSEVNVSYSDAMTGNSNTVTVYPDFKGGTPLDLDLGGLVASETMGRAVGASAAHYHGRPGRVRNSTLRDLAPGLASSQPPPFWADWRVGDLLELDMTVVADVATCHGWKIVQLENAPEARTATLSLVQLPDPVSGRAPWA
jgi:hypothetical protein